MASYTNSRSEIKRTAVAAGFDPMGVGRNPYGSDDPLTNECKMVLDQKLFSRELRQKTGTGSNPQYYLPVEEKESYRWLETPASTTRTMGNSEIVTLCDREADLYDFFKLSQQLDAAVLVRANADRTINRNSRYAKKDVLKLWQHMQQQPEMGSYRIKIPRRAKSKHCQERKARTAALTVRFSSFHLNPARNHPKHSKEQLPDIEMNAVYVLEANPPADEEPVEWMLLTNLPVRSLNEAKEKIRWYCLRWRIEMYFKLLKSGFRVEACRLADADRLARYLTVISIVAWRLFLITLIARTDPAMPCSTLLADDQWKALFLKINPDKSLPKKPAAVGEVVIWVAKLGGYLARRSDGPPGTISLWRGWKRLADLVQGWNLALQQ